MRPDLLGPPLPVTSPTLPAVLPSHVIITLCSQHGMEIMNDNILLCAMPFICFMQYLKFTYIYSDISKCRIVEYGIKAHCTCVEM